MCHARCVYTLSTSALAARVAAQAWKERRFRQQEANSLKQREELRQKDDQIAALQERIKTLQATAAQEKDRADAMESNYAEQQQLYKRKEKESRRVQERLMQGITTLQKRQDEMAGIVQIDNTPVPGATLEELQVRAG